MGACALTLIIGAVCEDGVLIAADSKVVHGNSAHFETKIHVVQDVVFAASGFTGLTDDFADYFQAELKSQGRGAGVDTVIQVKMMVEDILHQLWTRYKEGLGEEHSSLEVLLAAREQVRSGPSRLYHFEGGMRYGERMRTSGCIGSGADAAAAVWPFVFEPHLTMEDAARRAAFTIGWVADEVDRNVGGVPDVTMLPNAGQGKDAVQWWGREGLAKGEFDRGKQQRNNLRELFAHAHTSAV